MTLLTLISLIYLSLNQIVQLQEAWSKAQSLKTYRCNIALFSYGYRVTKLWNGLSPNAVWSPTLSLFKKYLDDEDFSDALILKFDTF